jgi:steroid delta-isomerase-like uncharacterized protein
MDADAMDALIERHVAAEIAGDVDAAITVYTPDVVHDVIGWPTGPVRGTEGAKGFYTQLLAELQTDRMDVTRKLHGADFCVVEHDATGTVHGAFLGIPGHGTQITFRMIHVFEFRDGLISRENIWLDGAAIAAQLTAANATPTAA